MSHEYQLLQNIITHTRSSLDDFVTAFIPTAENRHVFAEVKVYSNLINQIDLQIVYCQEQNTITEKSYSILKKFKKEVSLNGLRDLRRELHDEASRLIKNLE